MFIIPINQKQMFSGGFMGEKLSDNLISFSNILMLAHDRSEIIKIAGHLNNMICQALDMEKSGALALPEEKTKTLSAEIKFTQEEVNMIKSKTFKIEFIANGCIGRVIRRPSGKKNCYYEIRYRRHGYNVSVSHKDIDVAKKLFIEQTSKLDSPEKLAHDKMKFGNIIEEWLEYKKSKITYHQWQNHESRARRFIPDELKAKLIKDIHTNDIDKLLSFDNDPRLYEELRSLYNQIFKYGIASGIITHNPVTIIPFKRAERKKRKALTTDQIKAFLKRLQEPEFESVRQISYVLYFFGLRPCEIDDEAHFESGFLICRNRKRKNGKIEHKKIPVPKQALGLIDFNKPIKPSLSYNKWLDIIKKALSDGLTPYNLRHTFASICAESVKPDILDVWMGDSPERLVGKTYVHYRDKFMQNKMNTVKFIILNDNS